MAELNIASLLQELDEVSSMLLQSDILSQQLGTVHQT